MSDSRAATLKSPGEHRDYVRAMARLSFHFAFQWRQRHPDEPIRDVLKERTPLFRHAFDLMNNEGEACPGWRAMLARADEVLDAVSGPKEFERVLFEHVKAFADERADRSYPTSVGIQAPPSWNVGSLKYDPPKDNLPATYCNFHIANAVFPRSIFSDPDYLPACFTELMDRSEAEYGYDTLHTGTWLNERPDWLRLFPREWHDNLGPPSAQVSWHFGHWGQLVTARGTFNEKAGQYVREHGALRYKARSSHCSFVAMRTHLKGLPGARR